MVLTISSTGFFSPSPAMLYVPTPSVGANFDPNLCLKARNKRSLCVWGIFFKQINEMFKTLHNDNQSVYLETYYVNKLLLLLLLQPRVCLMMKYS